MIIKTGTFQKGHLETIVKRRNRNNVKQKTHIKQKRQSKFQAVFNNHFENTILGWKLYTTILYYTITGIFVWPVFNMADHHMLECPRSNLIFLSTTRRNITVMSYCREIVSSPRNI